tara:strand:- start:320 stop:550 length:231 start_codon:yes stop_codon:yes gene_type:complete
MEKLEKLIYSVKYLPQILYFGSVGLIGYDIYCSAINDTEFIPDLLMLPFTFFFFYMSYLAMKNYKSKKEFEVKNTS